MERILMILEVSQKQNYIFASKKLRENARRSAIINYVTSSDFFRKSAGEHYQEEENLVYSGGGHTVLQFDGKENAATFARQVTREALRQFQGLELFVKQIPYNEQKSPGQNLKDLSAALEGKKARRETSFRQMSFGIERLDKENYLPVRTEDRAEAFSMAESEGLRPPEGWEYPAQFTELAGKDNFIAVVHIDGNGMGKRVESIYEKCLDWNDCCRSLRRFSEGIQMDFEAAFRETVEEVVLGYAKVYPPHLPIRPVILAGDDVCFVTAGRIGLECARIFLEKLSVKENCEQPGMPYAACAGVTLIHQKFPFHQAYALAEELCSSAKRYGAERKEDGTLSVMDWHIEFGQMKEGLSALREDYITEDGNRLELRPVTVVVPDRQAEEKTDVRTYDFFKAMCLAMQGERGKVARGKIKQLRSAFKQGKLESRFFMQDRQISSMLDNISNAMYQTADQRMAKYREVLKNGGAFEKEAFVKTGDTERCIFFDAIEMIDHFEWIGEVEA